MDDSWRETAISLEMFALGLAWDDERRGRAWDECAETVDAQERGVHLEEIRLPRNICNGQTVRRPVRRENTWDGAVSGKVWVGGLLHTVVRFPGQSYWEVTVTHDFFDYDFTPVLGV